MKKQNKKTKKPIVQPFPKPDTPKPPTPREPIKEAKSEKIINPMLKLGMYIAAGLIMFFIIGSGITIMIKAFSLGPEGTMLSFIYVLSFGWMVAIVMIIPIVIARRQIWNQLKIFGRKSRVVIFRMIGGDANETEIVMKLKGNTVEIGENKVIINPRKATHKDGVRVMTYVADNALSHDYFQDPTKTLKQIGDDIKKKKQENFHDVYSDPIRIDAKYFNETFLAAQQSNPDILKSIIAFLTSKNIIVMLGIIAVAAGLAAMFSLQANNVLNTIPICNPTVITP
ncbi:MAG TPA: hypothetical protein ENI23_15480 [bacterium]|nr:hypothetical protein [bacterium]